MSSSLIFRQQHGHTLAARQCSDGSGQPIILLHGLLMSLNMWVIDTIFRDYGPCYAISLPGHYPATFPADFKAEALTPDLIAELLSDMITHLVGDQPVTLVGHSTGGFAALALAALRPQQVSRVMSLAGFAQGTWDTPEPLQRLGTINQAALQRFFQTLRLLTIHPELYVQAYRFIASNMPAFFSYPRLKSLMHVAYLDSRHLEARAISLYMRQMRRTNITPLLRHITAPVMAVTGDRDKIVPPTQAYLMARAIPHAELVVLANCGHMLFLENPRGYEEAARRFCATY